jgi:citrate lyase subunit gamma (acyl carrier protein)
MNVRRKATAGTMQSSDLTVSIEPADGLEIRVESTVKKQFEHLIRARIAEVLSQHGVQHALVQVTDRGALDYAIAARVETALRRAAEE